MAQCEFFNNAGKECSDNGMTFLYHNHEHEFRSFNGKDVLDIIVENTDPAYLSLELDTFWTMRAGLDPVETIKHFGNRIKLLHQKDFAWDAVVPINKIGLTADEREMKPGEITGIDGKSAYAQKGKHDTAVMSEEEAKLFKANYSAFTEIGTGIMRIQDIIDAANEYTNAEYIILEQDATRMPTQLDSIEKSMGAFQKFSGISWE
jgi:hypothetical protein